jgi:hypothetical protein
VANPASELQQLIAAWETIGPNARRILLKLAERLVMGKSHGDFTAPHDWDRETAEEELDGAVYRAAKLLGLGEPAAAPFVPKAGERVFITDIWDSGEMQDWKLPKVGTCHTVTHLYDLPVTLHGKTPPDGYRWICFRDAAAICRVRQ